MSENLEEMLREAALEYHRAPTPGKISVTPTKDLTNQRDPSLAYSPGWPTPVSPLPTTRSRRPRSPRARIRRGGLQWHCGPRTRPQPARSPRNRSWRGRLPIQEVRQHRRVRYRVERDGPDKIVEIVAALEPTFGGINLEDIKAPECFQVERKLRDRMKIPVFHDDQHGTAIIVAAAVLNGLRYVGKSIENVKLAGSGAGAAMLACLDLLVSLGLRRENVISDAKGVVYAGRKEVMDPDKERYARDTSARTLGDIMPSADVFLGLPAGGVVKPEMVKAMADKPLILALANPEPEIRPEAVKQVRSDALIFTGRSDYPNQVNNVLCFPFIFRGALDVGATTINEPMKIAAVHASQSGARGSADVVASAYGGQGLRFGPEYSIPTPSTRASSSVSLRRSRRRLWTAGSQLGRSPILKATATASPGSCTALVRSCSQYRRGRRHGQEDRLRRRRGRPGAAPSRPPSTSAWRVPSSSGARA